MYNSQLIIMLKRLTKSEINDFASFVASPYHNSDNRLIQLLEQIKTAAPTYANSILDRHHLFKVIFPNKKKYDSSLTVLFSRLKKLLENFYIQEHLKKDVFQQKKYLLQHSLEIGDWKMVEKEYKKAKIFHGKQAISIDFYQQEAVLERYYFDLLFYQRKNVELNLQKVSNNIDINYILHKLKLSWMMQSLSVLYNIKFKTPLLSEVLTTANTPPFNDNPLIRLFKKALLLTQSEGNMPFYNFKEELFEQSSLLGKREQYELYTLATNYCIHQIVKGDSTFNHVLFEIYEQTINNHIFIDGIYLSENKFKNVLSLGCKLKKWTWTKQFINDYSEKLNPEIRQQAKHFALGALYFYQKDYDKTLNYLRTDTNAGIYYVIDTKILLLKTYFILNYLYAFITTATAFKKYLYKNKKIASVKQKAYKNFISIAGKILKAKSEEKKQELLKIQQSIDDIQPISDKAWIKEQLNFVIEKNKSK